MSTANVRVNSASQQFIVRFTRRPEAELRLVCVPGAGDRPNLFRTWDRLLPEWVEVCAVQLPGHGARMLEPPALSHTPLVDDLVDEITAEVPGPIAILGHSMGALLGFELAHALGSGYVRHLTVAAYRAPHLPSPHRPVRSLNDDEMIDLVDKLGGPADLLRQEPELLALVLPVLRADFGLCEAYRYGHDRPLAIPVTALGGREDWFVTAEELHAWQRHTTAGFTVEFFPGSHSFFGEPPRPDVIASVTAALEGIPI